MLLVIVCYFFLMGSSQKYYSLSVLNYGISLSFLGSGSYSLTAKIPFQSDDVPNILYCWRKTKTVPQQDKLNCDLIFDQNYYRCLEVNYTRIPAGQISDGNGSFLDFAEHFQTSWTELTFSPQNGFEDIGNNSNSIEVWSPEVQGRTIRLNNEYLHNYSIYHMITGLSRQIVQSFDRLESEAKLNHVHTFSIESYSDTLIAQRQYYCILYKNKVIYLFEGAVLRNNKPYFFTGILTTTNDSAPFHMWGGYSYSSGHAARDMVAYESTTQFFYDMYSLYAAAPFQDIADNIQGQKNVVRISNSEQSSTTSNPFHFFQFYRLFDTQDIKGDEIIQNKIYNKFCFAAYFQDYIPNKTSYNLSVMSNSFKHELIDCHIPDLTLSSWNLTTNFLLVIICLALLTN